MATTPPATNHISIQRTTMREISTLDELIVNRSPTNGVSSASLCTTTNVFLSTVLQPHHIRRSHRHLDCRYEMDVDRACFFPTLHSGHY
jgi:hypothetical protein